MESSPSKYLLLDPYDFDQGDSGWRELDEKKQFLKAAQVIEQYLELNRGKVEEYDKENPGFASIMVFHAGQLYATAGPKYYKTAEPFFELSLRDHDEPWNQYVKGTVAFLNNDLEALNRYLVALRQGDPKHVRVQVLERLVKGLRQGITYEKAYDGKFMLQPRRPRRLASS